MPGETLQVSQSHWAYDPNGIHDAFFQHWSTYWERDDSDLGIPSGLTFVVISISSTKASMCVADGGKIRLGDDDIFVFLGDAHRAGGGKIRLGGFLLLGEAPG